MLAEYVTVADPSKAGEKVAVFAIMFFVFFYGLFIDAASFIYSSEIYPTNIRSRGMALASFTYFTACIVSRVARLQEKLIQKSAANLMNRHMSLLVQQRLPISVGVTILSSCV